MPSRLIILFFSLCLFGIAQPKVVFADSKKNFGFVKKGEIVKLDYSFKNEGNSPLIFSEFKVACECTQVLIPSKPVLPGESGEIKITFNTQTVYDRQDRIVEIYSNDPKKLHKLRFKGVVLK